MSQTPSASTASFACHWQDSAFGAAAGNVVFGTTGDDLYQLVAMAIPPEGLTLVDPGGVDAISALGVDGRHTIDLRPGANSTIGGRGLTIDPSTQLEVALGGSSDDVLIGNALANTLDGSGGNDILRGDGGVDVANYSGAWAGGQGYALTRTAAGITLVDRSGRDGTDMLQEVERLAFSDVTVAFDIGGPAGMAFRLYQTAFLRRPDEPGLGFHIRSLEAGLSLVNVAAQFIASPEFTQRYGGLSDTDFVSLLYINALGRPADPEGLAFHVNTLRSGFSRADVLVGFSESPENHAQLIGVMEAGMVYSG